MNMKKIGLRLAVCAALAVSGSAFAADRTGIVVGGDLGYSFLSSYPSSIDGYLTKKNSHFAWGVYGGYQYGLNEMFALGVDVGYNGDGSVKYTNALGASRKGTQDDVSVLLGATYYLDQTGFSVFGKVGAARVTEKRSGNSSNGGSIHKTFPKVALGAGYMVMPNLNVNFSYDHTFGGGKDDLDSKPQSIDRIMLGVSYLIPMQ